ncbi:MAG: hypothetical protein ACXVB9_20440 [Bdellovibrionota bacterium]
MKHALKILAGTLVVLALGALVSYFISDPDLHITKKRANQFAASAQVGLSLADALRGNADFKSVTFGSCGHLDASPDSGPKGSLIFSPAVGEFARYTSVDEFFSHNPKLISAHEECRTISVLYMTIFPYRGQIDLSVDERGLIRKRNDPVFFD